MLHDILARLDWGQILLGGIPLVGGAIWAFMRKRIARWRAFWREISTGIRTLPELNRDVKGIRYFVAPNGGGSLMDAVKRIEAKNDSQSEQLDLVVHTMWAENDSDEDIGRFHCSADGQNTYINALYARWLGVGKTDLLGWNFLNFVHHDDAERVREHWEDCRVQMRQYRMRHRMVAADGHVIRVEVIASPIPEKPPIKRWIGSVRRLDDSNSKHDGQDY